MTHIGSNANECRGIFCHRCVGCRGCVIEEAGAGYGGHVAVMGRDSYQEGGIQSRKGPLPSRVRRIRPLVDGPSSGAGCMIRLFGIVRSGVQSVPPAANLRLVGARRRLIRVGQRRVKRNAKLVLTVARHATDDHTHGILARPRAQRRKEEHQFLLVLQMFPGDGAQAATGDVFHMKAKHPAGIVIEDIASNSGDRHGEDGSPIFSPLDTD